MSRCTLLTLILPKRKFWMMHDEIWRAETDDKTTEILILHMMVQDNDLGIPLDIPKTYPTDPETKDIIARNHQTTTNIYQPPQTTNATTPSLRNILLLTLY